MKAKLKIYNVISDQGTTYDEIKEALLGCTAMSFSSAAEAFCTEAPLVGVETSNGKDVKIFIQNHTRSGRCTTSS